MKESSQFKLLVAVTCLGLAVSAAAQKKSKYVCDEPNPASLCTAANTCGSASNPCTVNINKSGSSSTVKPTVPDAKGNQFFCIKKGTRLSG